MLRWLLKDRVLHARVDALEEELDLLAARIRRQRARQGLQASREEQEREEDNLARAAALAASGEAGEPDPQSEPPRLVALARKFKRKA